MSPEAVAAANGMPASASGLAADGREATPEPGAAGMLAPGVPGVGGAGIGSDGNLVITVVEAKELAHDGEHDVYAELNLGKHTIGKTKRQKSVSPQFGDHFTVKTTKEPMVIKLAVLLHKTFGSDKEIGEVSVRR